MEQETVSVAIIGATDAELAALRNVLCEILRFTDRPDYSIPTRLRPSFNLLTEKAFVGENPKQQLYRSYCEPYERIAGDEDAWRSAELNGEEM